MALELSACVAALVVAFSPPLAPPWAPPPGSSGAASDLREFSPGIRLNWQRHQVELDATVVLRKGPLELVACSPRTREHESILVVRGRPRDIYQAMGLIGLKPGSPIRDDPTHDAIIPARGHPLEISVRWTVGGRSKTEPIERWLVDHKTHQPPEKIRWVFAGSRTLKNGRFTADLEGTVICVVDFESALVAPASLHTSDNEFLWLRAHTEAIPPRGTKCTLLIRALKATPTLEVEIAADGAMRFHGRAVDARDVARMIRRQVMEGLRVEIVLIPSDATPQARVDSILSALTGQGLDPKSIRVQRTPADQPSSSSPSPVKKPKPDS